MNNVDKYEIRENLHYDSNTHFWLDVSGHSAVIGMSPLIQETSGSFVAVQFAKPGTSFKKGESIGTVEAEKHVGPLKAPVSGTVRLVNEAVINNPRLINEEPYDGGWLMEIDLSNASEIDGMITGEKNIKDWFESELKKFDEKGWTAQP